MNKLRKYPTYRDAMHTQSVLTITSNVVYGKATGNTPDGRRHGEPFAPGANPMHGRDSHGIHAAAASVAKIPYRDAADGISLTATLVPSGLGRTGEDRITNLTSMLDAFFGVTGYHMNVNVLNRETLLDAMDHPEKYPHLTIRVSGYAVNFVRLTREQQMDVINRTFHGRRHECAVIPSAGGDADEQSAQVTRGARARSSFASTSGRASRSPTSGRRSPPATWGSCTPSPPARPSMAPASASSRGRRAACGAACYCHNPDTWTMRNGIPVTIARAVEELRKYRHGLRVMSGGFTLSGGEPLMQDRFAVKLLTAAKQMGVHTALDTNGYYGGRLTDEELEAIDLVLLDLKGWDPERHERLTGMDNGPTLAFARRLAARKRPVWVRFVLVPGWSDDPATIEGVAGFAASLGNVERVDVLPFHQMGRYKWAQLGLTYQLDAAEPPSQDAVEQACAVFRAKGLRAV